VIVICKQCGRIVVVFRVGDLCLYQEAGNSLSRQPLTVDNVPIIVEKLINFVGLHGKKIIY